MPGLSIADVSKTFTVDGKPFVALEGATLNLAPGEFGALIGPSGCGKSTLLRMVADLVAPSSGTITLDDAPPGTQLSEQLEEVAMMQSYLTEGDARTQGLLRIDPAEFEENVALGREAGTVPANLPVDVSKIVTQSVIRAALGKA